MPKESYTLDQINRIDGYYQNKINVKKCSVVGVRLGTERKSQSCFREGEAVVNNYSIAISYCKGPEDSLVELESKKGEWGPYMYLYHATKADLFNRLGDYAKARTYYEVALDHTSNTHEQQFLQRKLDNLQLRNLNEN